MRLIRLSLLAFITLGMSMTHADQALVDEVTATESAFAATMADRDFEAFRSFLDPDTIFFAGESPIRGAEAVAAAWAPFFTAEAAPFSWSPMTVVVNPGGEIALSSGPVFDPSGMQVAVFNSVWHRQDDGRWLIIFDKGGQYCPPPKEDGVGDP